MMLPYHQKSVKSLVLSLRFSEMYFALDCFFKVRIRIGLKTINVSCWIFLAVMDVKVENKYYVI